LSSKDSKKRIQVSLLPANVNSGLSALDLHENTMLSCEVLSKEDHGYICDLGLADITAFLPMKECVPGKG
jgi:rRNA biogenesis protein RRP5